MAYNQLGQHLYATPLHSDSKRIFEYRVRARTKRSVVLVCIGFQSAFKLLIHSFILDILGFLIPRAFEIEEDNLRR